MADTYYKLVGSTNPQENWLGEVVLARDEETGEVTKSIKAGVPTTLTADEKKTVERVGGKLESSSKEEAKEAQKSGAALADVAGQAPTFTTSDDDGNKDKDDKDNK